MEQPVVIEKYIDKQIEQIIEQEVFYDVERVVETPVYVDKEIKRTILQPRKTQVRVKEIVEEIPVYQDEIHETYVEKVT